MEDNNALDDAVEDARTEEDEAVLQVCAEPTPTAKS
jgi:hypothetical protein